jgi:cytochrome c
MSKSAERARRLLPVAVVLALAAFGSPPTSADNLGLGRAALPEEIAAWDIDVRPDGQGLPEGSGSVADGEALFVEKCAACHGEFGEGVGRWPVLAGGYGTLTSERPEKTVGSFWPHTSTAFDYINRTMPFGDGQSLAPDEVYAILAYVLNLNDVVPQDFVLSKQNFTSVTLENAPNFFDDDRDETERAFWKAEPCMTDCKSEVKIIGHALVLDVTPDDGGPTDGAGGVD